MTDFQNLAQLSSDALLVVAGGRVVYANPAAHALLAPAGGPQDMQGRAVQTLWSPNPLEDAGAWDGQNQLPPTSVGLPSGSAAQGTVTCELTATRSLTPQGPVYYVKARRVQGPGDRLAERVRTALALSPDAAMVVDARTLAFLDANDAACTLLGMPIEAVRTRGPTTMRRRDGSGTEDFHALYAQLIEHSPQALTHEYDFIADDGRTVPIAATRQALSVDGRWLIFITWRDISAQVSAQALVQQFKDAFDQAPDATNIIDVQTLSYVYVNEPFLKLVGLPRERVLAGGPLSMPREIVVVDDLAAFVASVVAHHPHALVREKTVTLPDGRQASFESHHQAVFSGGRWLVRATRVDITQRKQQQHHLHRVMAAIDSAVDAIFIIDPATMGYVEVNEAAASLFETPRETLRTLHVPDLMPRLSAPFSNDELAGHYQALIRQAPQPMTTETAVRQSSGRWVPVENVRRAVQVNGEWLIVSVMRDVSARKEAQLQLELLKAAFNAAPDAILVIDPVTRGYVEVNEAATQLYGLPRDQMITAGIAGASRQDDETRTYLDQVYAKVIAQSPLPDTEVRRLSRINGNDPIIEATRRAMCLDGRWLIVSVNRDITQRLATQERVERFAAIVNLSSDAVLVHDPQRMALVDVNEAACRLYGYSREQLLALPPTLNRPDQTLEDMRRIYEATIAAAPKALRTEFITMRGDGSPFPAEAYRQAIPSSDGWLVVATVRDITERKRAESEIRKRVAELELLREAYDAAVDAILIADPETLGYHDVNHAAVKLLGVSREDLLARGVEASYYSTAGEPFDAERFRKGSRYVISRAPEALIEVRTVNPLGLGGRDTVIEFSRRGVNINGRWVIVTLMRDITAAQRAEEEIRQRVAELTRSNQELEQFAYVTSHDLSEPLRMVASYTQLLSKRYADKFDDDGREFIKYAVDGAQRMKQLIDDLLMYSRAGRSKVPMRHIRLDRALDDALANLAHAIGRNDAVVERTPLPELVCEKAGLTQVFQNLVGNAIKFRGEAAPVVRISAMEDAHFWTISVSDNGIGIAPEYFQRIFVIFQRLHSRTKYEGTGIGLSICKKIVERHGGQITVTSEPGLGTTFSFTLSKSLTESESP